MELEYRLFDKNNKDNKELKYLFENSFPEEERPSYKTFISFKKQQLYLVCLDNKFVAMADLVINKDLVYLFFLAVKEEYRKLGIGSQILKDLLNKHNDKRVFLLAEEVDPKYDNYLERKARLHFYQNNNFELSNIIVTEFDIRYHLLNNHHNVEGKEFFDMMLYLLGKKRYEKYYIKNMCFTD